MPAESFPRPPGLVDVLGPQLVECGTESIYPWAPVFRARFTDDRPAVVKRSLTNRTAAAAIARVQRAVRAAGIATVVPLDAGVDWPVTLTDGEDVSTWIGYPWIAGAGWDGTVTRLEQAARQLGRLHRVGATLPADGLTPFSWPQADAASVEEDVAAITAVYAEHLPDRAEAADRWVEDLRRFPTTILPRFAVPGGAAPGLVMLPGSMDFRAENLIFTDAGPVLVDWEKTDWLPRVLDLAFTVVFFAHETPNGPGRLMSRSEWLGFLAAYLEEAPAFTAEERAAWPDAVTYQRLEEGTWFLTEGAEWELSDVHTGFLLDLLTLDDTRFAWPDPS